ncbi:MULTISPECIES: Tet(A)/Tet(B)/Tet(C) family tetracycline efflux MFS transporter [unclassified Duganella]|uniref:Tet(A)/Tet(B)/Tet(C) family tetracycline efflux MFS transporter n=1 Tax=unclassified Duganella TaxID=2636909 RepID=UPI000E354F2D|nr:MULTISPECIES: Tet(A)/Tet(B)/Tet(C) family tetracycline efflux MFS transporter [unclassified Duganella]RFP12798.1 Tet(A)/Tet(B)/Tet(C) family tetracycline efflux MFS transporter [Duganella sp. BJB475]RFP28807.1 Tet(A)/Tet(B)/Tet(C) family tetracycline efflux MFS transporter [Duganella sp. BJB476]
MNRALLTILSTVVLSAVGIGLTMPIIPQLMRDVGHTSELGWRFGAFTGLYALMQFIFSPILGVLSDRIGRRPVLLLSLAGTVVDYLFMAMAPSLALLFVGRAIAGITGASMAVTSAYIADVTPEDQRSRRYGQLGACFGIGFIIGPVIGGLLGAWWVRAPFLAAAAMNAVNLILTLLVVRESHTPRAADAAPAERMSFNPLANLRWAASFKSLLPLIGASGVLVLIGEIGGTVWVLYGEDKFAWDSLTIGISLAGFGAFHALAQAFVVGPIAERWGERRALLVGIAADSCAYILIALASQGWMAFALMPLFCLGGIGAPALQSLVSASVGPEQQGKLQGVLASTASLATVIGPVAISTIYFMSRGSFPGLVWLIGAGLCVLCLPVLMRKPEAPPAAS